jgi:hypothetical protein
MNVLIVKPLVDRLYNEDDVSIGKSTRSLLLADHSDMSQYTVYS